ncbi:MAG: CocE/NonD family hydrolase [Pseudomonadota bacterium]|nr:CocE/NonD family hydrolase [Pseudomonadota bacterium]
MKPKSKVLLIDGPAGQLEIRIFNVSQGDETQKLNDFVVISHPHPEFGGTMDNKVVTTLERTFQSMGYGTVTYNFRGVGASEGRYDGGVGEQQDLQAVVDWLKSSYSFERLVLAGFSFGAYVTLSAQSSLEADRLLIVAPPVGLYDFSEIKEVEQPWDMVIGLEDEVISVAEMMQWAMAREFKPSLYCRSGASHFFHGQLIWLKKVILSTY